MKYLFIASISISFLTILIAFKMKSHAPQPIYTLGIWTAMEGKENDFIKEWESFAKWTSGKYKNPGNAYLLRDEQNPSNFISFGPWNSKTEITEWRNTNEFKLFVEKIRNVCSEFKPHTLQIAATSAD